MFSRRPISPRLPANTLALTYDDGPGPHSVEIGEFLHSKGIRATFFVVGKHVRQYPNAVGKLAELGHVIGNHTDTHTDLLTIKDTPARLVAEVLEADRLIAGLAKGGTRFFRPPRGRWSPDVADELNRHEELTAYAGPIHWNIDAADWQIGLRRGSPPADEVYTVDQCANAYLETIVAKSSGVVLLHDWLADAGKLGDYLREKSRTLELTKLLIPQLSGFQFAALDEVWPTHPNEVVRWPAGWNTNINDDRRRQLEREAEREIPAGHVLHGQSLAAMAIGTDPDDVVFKLLDGRLAVVHLTWREETDVRFPFTSVFDGIKELERSDQDL